MTLSRPPPGQQSTELLAGDGLLHGLHDVGGTQAVGVHQVVLGTDLAEQVLHESENDAATIITSGIMVDESLKAYESLQAEGISVRVIDMFTWKPLDEELVIKAAKETGAIVTAENHNVTCGLGSVVANCLAKNCPTIQEFVGVQDLFGEVGPQDYLMDRFGLRAANIVEAVKKAVSRK